jgi:hypothetical protein
MPRDGVVNGAAGENLPQKFPQVGNSSTEWDVQEGAAAFFRYQKGRRTEGFRRSYW